MGVKNLVFLINLHHPYIKLGKEEFVEFEEEGTLLFRTISEYYLPLLNMLSKFEKEKIKAKFALVFSSSVCALLSDDDIKKKYNKWQDNLIEFAKKEVARTKRNSAQYRVAQANLENAIQNKRSFNETYGGDLLAAFNRFSERGLVEILATCGTYLFMPHYSDMPEILNAQVESGIYSIKTYFGKAPAGFFLPEMGYIPGIEDTLKLYGVEYTVLPNMSFLFSKIPPQNGIFMPARCQNSLAIFAAENFYARFSSKDVYKNTKNDLAWELSNKELAPFVSQGHSRHASGFFYQNNGGENYIAKNALLQAKQDAKEFLEEKSAALSKAQIILGDDADVSLSVYFDNFILHRFWAEGFVFLESLVRQALDSGVSVTSYETLLEGKAESQKITPYPAAYAGSVYGENLVSSQNCWMVRYVRKASERIVDLVSRFPNDGGLKARLLNLGARELMLVQDCTLAKMIDLNIYSNFATEYFKRGIVSFSNVYDALGSNTVSTEWFCALEKSHQIFPWMNYRIFAKKR